MLTAWIGLTDLRASKGEEKRGTSPIASAVNYLELERVVLCSITPEE